MLSKLYERQTIICTFLFGLTFRSERAREFDSRDDDSGDNVGYYGQQQSLDDIDKCVCMCVFVCVCVSGHIVFI